MVSVHVHCQLYHLGVKSIDHLGQIEMVQTFVAALIIFKNISGEFVYQSLNGSGAVNIQGDVYNLSNSAHNDLIESLGISHLNDLLAKVISKLVYHYTREDGQHLIYQASVKFAFIFRIKICLLNFCLEISAARLIKAIELETHQDLLVLRRENFLLESLGKCVLLAEGKEVH